MYCGEAPSANDIHTNALSSGVSGQPLSRPSKLAINVNMGPHIWISISSRSLFVNAALNFKFYRRAGTNVDEVRFYVIPARK